MEKDTSVNLGKIIALFMSIKREIIPCYVQFLLLKIVSSSDQYALTYCGDLIVTAFEKTVKKFQSLILQMEAVFRILFLTSQFTGTKHLLIAIKNI